MVPGLVSRVFVAALVLDVLLRWLSSAVSSALLSAPSVFPSRAPFDSDYVMVGAIVFAAKYRCLAT